MGRASKGVNKINESYCLDYTYLSKLGLINKQQGTVKRRLEWTKEGQVIKDIIIKGKFNPVLNISQLTLTYMVNESNGNCCLHEIQIDIAEVNSNLKIGKFGYFICPVTGYRCRKLYQTVNSDNWQCRKAFAARLFYPVQLCSKMQSYVEKSHAYHTWIEKHSEGKISNFYKGKFTKRYKRIKRLTKKQIEMNQLALSPLAMPLSMRRLFPDGLLNDFFRLYG